MTSLAIELPESLKKRIEALAAKEGYTVSQFLASAAAEKMAVVTTTDCPLGHGLRMLSNFAPIFTMTHPPHALAIASFFGYCSGRS